MMLDHDLHIHTYLSECCSEKDRQKPDAIISLAEKMDMRTIGFSDHLWENPDLVTSDFYRSQDKRQILRLRNDLANISTDVNILVGCEADTIAPGKFGITPKFAETLDYVLLSCSHFHMKGFVEQPESAEPRDIARHILKFFRSGVSCGLATSIAHPFLPYGYLEKFDEAVDSMSNSELQDSFGLAADNQVAIEITTEFIPCGSKPKFSIETPIHLISIAKEVGCKFTFGTDAHSPEVQQKLPELIQIIKAVGLTEEDVLPILDKQH